MADDEFINARIAEYAKRKTFGTVEEVLTDAMLREPRKGDEPDSALEFLRTWAANDITAILAYLDVAGYKIDEK